VNLIQQGSFLTLHYRLAGPDGGELINTFADKPATLSLGNGELAPAIEQRLIGLAEGTHTRFELAPGEAFAPEAQGWLRWCFASRDLQRLGQGVARLKTWLADQA